MPSVRLRNPLPHGLSPCCKMSSVLTTFPCITTITKHADRDHWQRCEWILPTLCHIRMRSQHMATYRDSFKRHQHPLKPLKSLCFRHLEPLWFCRVGQSKCSFRKCLRDSYPLDTKKQTTTKKVSWPGYSSWAPRHEAGSQGEQQRSRG